MTGTHQHGCHRICDKVVMVLQSEHRRPGSVCSSITIKAQRKCGPNYIKMGVLIGGKVTVICGKI